MTPDQYAKLSENEKLMYNEMNNFALRVTARMEEIITLLKKAVTDDPA